jgi:undecaprenyl-diphosphatase
LGSDVMVTATLLCAYIWYLWFKPNVNQHHIRLSLLSTILGSAIASAVSRVSPLLGLPHRAIPMIQSDIGFIVPLFAEAGGHETASSLPSDHSALIFGLVFGIFLVSRKVGFWALMYALFFMAIPRIYVGLHFASDIIIGAAIGVFFVYLTHSKVIVRNFSAKVLDFSEQSPPVFYGLMFLTTFELATLFAEIRNFMHVIKGLITGHII